MNVEMIEMVTRASHGVSRGVPRQPRQTHSIRQLDSCGPKSANAVQDSLVVVVLSRPPIVEGLTYQTQDVVDVLFL